MPLDNPLEISYDAADAIPPAFKDLYEDRGGKFVLTGVKGYKTQADIDALQSVVNKERQRATELAGKYKPWENLNHEEVLAKLDKYSELELAASGKLDENKLNEMAEARFKTKVAPIERERDTLKTNLDTALGRIAEFEAKEKQRNIHDAIRAIATKMNVQPTAVDDVLMLGERMLDIDEAGNVITKEGNGVTPGLNVEAWLQEMQPKRPHWWPASAGGGAGGNPGGGTFANNPWSPEHWNMTEQGKQYNANPARAEQMAKAAGTTVGGPRPQPKK